MGDNGLLHIIRHFCKMPRKKRAHTGNLGELAKKKVRPESVESDNEEAEMPSSSLMEQSEQPLFDWETGNIEDVCDERATVESETESILSTLSEDEDVPTSDAASLNAFCRRL